MFIPFLFRGLSVSGQTVLHCHRRRHVQVRQLLGEIPQTCLYSAFRLVALTPEPEGSEDGTSSGGRGDAVWKREGDVMNDFVELRSIPAVAARPEKVEVFTAPRVFSLSDDVIGCWRFCHTGGDGALDTFVVSCSCCVVFSRDFVAGRSSVCHSLHGCGSHLVYATRCGRVSI